MRPGLARTAALIRMEMRFTLTRPLFWIWLAVLLLTAVGVLTDGTTFITQGDSAAGGKHTWITSEFAITSVQQMFTTVITTFFAAVIAGLPLIRDSEARVGDLLHATPLRVGEYVWGRFLGAFLALCVGVCLYEVGTALMFHALPYAHADPWRGPFEALNYLRPALIFQLPYLLFVAGISFAVGGTTRQPILIFVLPFGILLLAFVLIAYANDEANTPLAHILPLLDPTGAEWFHRTFTQIDRGADFYNHARITLTPMFAVSRIAVALSGLFAVCVAQVHITRLVRNPGPAAARRSAAGAGMPAPEAPWARGVLASARPAGPIPPLSALRMTATHRPALLACATAAASAEIREILRQPGLYLFTPLLMIGVACNAVADRGMFSTERLLTSGYLAADQMRIVGTSTAFLLLAYTVESLERDRSARLDALRNAMPLRTAAVLLGKLLALLPVAAALLIGSATTLLIMIAAQHAAAPNPAPFLLLWGLILIPGFLCWIPFIAALYILTGHNRYAAYGLGLVALTVFCSAPEQLDWATNLFAFGTIRWSDLAPLEMDRSAIVLSRMFVLSAAIFWSAVDIYAYRRREPDAAGRSGRRRWGYQIRALLPLAPFAAVPIALGIWLAIRIDNGPEGRAQTDREKDYWRRNLDAWKDAPLPDETAVDMAVDLFPERRSFAARGTLTLANHGDRTLIRIPVTAGFGWTDLHWSLDGRPYEPEERAGLYVFTPPGGSLAPGASIRLGFSYHAPPIGPTRNGVGNGGDSDSGEMSGWEFVLPSAVVLNSFNHSFVPEIGYDTAAGVDDDNRYDASDEQATADVRPEERHTPLFGSASPLTLRLAVSAPADFLVNGVGRPIVQPTANGRRVVVWEADRSDSAPIHDFNLVGGRGLVARFGRNGTAVCYYPGHGFNVAQMLRALDAARTWYGAWFAPYPWKELRLTEFPDMAGYAQSFPTNISFGEGMGFLTRAQLGGENESSDAFAVTAHEAAHQWWGNMIVPARGPGGNVLSEGLAHFSAALLIGQVQGPSARRQFLRTIEAEYNRSRSVDSELPLARMTGDKAGDSAVTYDKGGWVFTMLSEQVMGRSQMLAGLRAYIARFRGADDPPTIADLIATLRRFAPDPSAFDAFVQQWFYRVALPEYRVSATKRRVIGSETLWRVTCLVTNLGNGKTIVPVAVLSSDGDLRADALVDVPAGGVPVTVTITTDFPPARVLADPDVTILQRNRNAAAAAI